MLTMVHSMSTSAPNMVSTSIRYGEYGTPDNILENKKYINSRRKGLITSGCNSCFQELSVSLSSFFSPKKNYKKLLYILINQIILIVLLNIIFVLLDWLLFTDVKTTISWNSFEHFS